MLGATEGTLGATEGTLGATEGTLEATEGTLGAMEGTWGPSVCLTLLASLWYFTAFLVSATARSTNPTDWSMLFSMRSIMAP